jgi:hypothetical protein
MNPRFAFIDLARSLLHRLVDHAAEKNPDVPELIAAKPAVSTATGRC